MIDFQVLNTEEKLAEMLAGLGFASESPAVHAHWTDEPLLRKLSVARRLIGEGYRNLLVATESDSLSVYNWTMLVCRFHGVAAEGDLIEKINLAAFPERAPADLEQCICLDLPQPFHHYEKVKFVGVDEINGRFGQVNIHRCLHCGRLWVHYFVEYEAYRKSGRYFMGMISPEDVVGLTAETAVSFLESLDWHLYGGSFFEGVGRSTSKQLYVDG